MMTAEKYWPMVVVLMMFAWWARATYAVGLTAIIMAIGLAGIGRWLRSEEPVDLTPSEPLATA